MKQPFDLLRAVFWLLAVVMIFEMVTSVMGGVLCWWLNFQDGKQPGACLPAAAVIREVFSEILTAALALLLAGRPPPPG